MAEGGERRGISPAAGAISLACLGCGLALAWHHPIAPAATVAAVLAWALAVWRRPDGWLFWVPFLLPVLNFSPWTGWLLFSELDLALLATAAGGYGARALAGGGPGKAPGLVLAFAASSLVALARGLGAGEALEWDWFQGYGGPLNGLALFKAPLFAVLLLPLAADSRRRDPQLADRRLTAGMSGGLALAGLAVLWERAAFPGLLDLATPYRTTALFWEMHVGGAALDGYLALAFPFALGSFLSARGPWRRRLAALLVLLAGYACLTAFARGLYLGLLLGTAVLALAFHTRRPSPRRRRNVVAALAALSLPAVLVPAASSFLAARLEASGSDLAERLQHWREGLAFLESPADIWLGRGLGRYPADYQARSPRGENPGGYRLEGEGPEAFMVLHGPASLGAGARARRLSQRVLLAAGAGYRLRLTARSAAGADIRLRLCERHLLYEGGCLRARLRVEGPAWQSLETELQGEPLAGGPWYAPRLGFLFLDASGLDQAAAIDDLSLIGPDGRQLLANGDFAQGGARWFPTVQHYFLPWHVDNLFLAVLLDQGALGLLLVLALFATALVRTMAGTSPAGPWLAASLAGFLGVGLLSSPMDGPRLAFLALFLAGWALGRPPAPRTTARPA